MDYKPTSPSEKQTGSGLPPEVTQTDLNKPGGSRRVFNVGKNGAIATAGVSNDALKPASRPSAPIAKKKGKGKGKPKKVCRNLRLCGAAPVPVVTRNLKKLSAVEREELDAAGAGDAVRRTFEQNRRDRAERMRNDNKNLPAQLQKQARAMVRSVRGKRFFSAHGAGAWFVARGLHEPVRYYTGFGGALGLEGLKLPSFIFEGRRYFDLLCADMTPTQKSKRAAQIKQIGIDILAALIAG